MRPLALIAAIAEGHAIGREGKLPWRIPEDMARFKTLTMGHAVIMGRSTHEAIGRPLPGRTNIVLSHSGRNWPGCMTATSLGDALELAKGDELPFIIGGAQVYTLAMPRATHLYLTWLALQVTGADTFFPQFEISEWREASRVEGGRPGVTFVDYLRVDDEAT